MNGEVKRDCQGCELPDMGTGNETWVLCRSSKWFLNNWIISSASMFIILRPEQNNLNTSSLSGISFSLFIHILRYFFLAIQFMHTNKCGLLHHSPVYLPSVCLSAGKVILSLFFLSRSNFSFIVHLQHSVWFLCSAVH